ncbi:type II toxin-antitoxin system VapC family toxin [Saccharopolyspora hirsuta]|uniref:Ribonuclease VapC n=1 Tax=Saccharopolyspora hirsuta TaxID=1837 RepID=A0A5M7BPR8_SACHI|nr:type II toxin-antitoxin system VapC family toxin [Saccharopolyspora hirsuta]KAA5830148.1 type II toxin-antitoxin system VapC family toxin [Saccharopolyspora hirsuta]
MIIDSSAIVAILLKEEGYERLIKRLAEVDDVAVGAPTAVETGIVLTARLGVVGRTLLARFFEEVGVEVVDCAQEHWKVAVEAYERFGKGRHPAGLNFGDCLTYAVAWVSGRPLLCVGDDFPKTDLVLVEG